VSLVEAMDLFPIKSLVSNLHPSAEGSNGRKILYREPDCLSGRRKATTYESRTRSTLALCHEQFGWQPVVEGYHFFVQIDHSVFCSEMLLLLSVIRKSPVGGGKGGMLS
jgi:hypothetical protein